MTAIKTVPNIDNTKLNDLVRSLIRQVGEETRLMKGFNIVIDGPNGARVEPFSFDELEALVNIIDLNRPAQVRIDPAQWLIMTYELMDLDKFLNDGYRLTEYKIDLDSIEKVVKFTGTITHKHCIPGHPEFDSTIESHPKEFEFILGDFDILQQMAITRAMASRDSKFDPVAGTIDVSWIYSFSAEGITFTSKDIE